MCALMRPKTLCRGKNGKLGIIFTEHSASQKDKRKEQCSINKSNIKGSISGNYNSRSEMIKLVDFERNLESICLFDPHTLLKF